MMVFPDLSDLREGELVTARGVVMGLCVGFGWWTCRLFGHVPRAVWQRLRRRKP